MPKIPSRSPIYIGVDPGKSGGLAALLAPKPRFNEIDVVKMPATERDVWEWFNGFGMNTIAVIEKVGGFIKGNPTPGSRMFNFGWGYGGLRMAMIAAGIPFEEVTPNKWQRGMGIPARKKTETDTQWKNRLKARAQQLFPSVRVTLATADALLIAEYCRRKHEGGL